MRMAILLLAAALLAGCGDSSDEADTTDPVPLPSATQIRADYQKMVDFGPRLTGYEAHEQFVGWLETEFVKAGLELLPCDQYEIDRWKPESFGLEFVDGSERVDIATSYVRSASTGPDGVVGPLVYVGADPVTDLTGLAGSIVVVDVPVPRPLTGAVLAALSSYLHWPGHSDEDWAQIDYRRLWAGPWPDLANFADAGVAGVVLVVDGPLDELRGNYSDHTARPRRVPALVVDRDTGRTLKERAVSRPRVHLTLNAQVERTHVRNVTAVLRGESDEVIIASSHTDGQNAFEENGAVALVQLARHFASLPKAQRLRRTLVFAAYPGHMSGTDHIESASGWILAHTDIVARAAAAVHPEHLGATEWVETPEQGYHATGENEMYAIWTTQGRMFELAKDALLQADLYRHGLMHGPIRITPGEPLHLAGVPFAAGIAGPTYLLVVSENGEIDKLDAELAARQTAFYADIMRRADAVPADELRSGDPTLGASPPKGEDVSTPVTCGPSGTR